MVINLLVIKGLKFDFPSFREEFRKVLCLSGSLCRLVMIVNDDSSDSELEGRLSVSPAVTRGGAGMKGSSSPTHFVKFKPLELSEPESEEDDEEHLKLPTEVWEYSFIRLFIYFIHLFTVINVIMINYCHTN